MRTTRCYLISALVTACVLGWPAGPAADPIPEIVIYGFEADMEGWQIPPWARGNHDYVGQEVRISQAHVQEGDSALELWSAFPGDRWAGAYVERELEVTDWSAFGRLSVSVYLAPEAPDGLEGRIILTVGDQWEWTEQNRAIELEPGGWTQISVNLGPESLDWKFFPDEMFRNRIRKVGVRIESNHGPAYTGPVYVDNIRLSEE